MSRKRRYGSKNRGRSAATLLGAGVAAAAAGYATWAGLTWYRYGRPSAPRHEEADPLMDRFMPVYDIVERHSIEVDAPADTTLAAARNQDIAGSPLVRGIFRLRELALGSTAKGQRPTRGLIEEVQSLGWGILAEIPDREIVVGAVTKPWEADVVFTPLDPAEFAAFAQPDYVKIIWSLRADPTGPESSTFRTETRAVPTDEAARAKFRRYWSFVAPGVSLIRHLMLRPLKATAERGRPTLADLKISDEDVS